MRFFRSKFFSSIEILESYRYPQPFNLHLKGYFKQHKKFGSKDRRSISDLCYAYWRTLRILKNERTERALLIASALLLEIRPEDWNALASELGIDLQVDEAFFAQSTAARLDSLGLTTENVLFQQSLLNPQFEAYNSVKFLSYKPKVWIRNETLSAEECKAMGLEPSDILVQAYSTERLQEEESGKFQIQDLASQYLCSKVEIAKGQRVWDCCCGAGGKSLATLSRGSEHYLSDLRDPILKNANKRLKRFQKKPKAVRTFDMISAEERHPFEDMVVDFDLVIADVPCSGSGTWFRSPEHFYNFDEQALEQYVDRQKKIVARANNALCDGGQLYYMTCSLFSAENEEVVAYAESLGMHCEFQEYFNGFEQGSDSMFVALLVKA